MREDGEGARERAIACVVCACLESLESLERERERASEESQREREKFVCVRARTSTVRKQF